MYMTRVLGPEKEAKFEVSLNLQERDRGETAAKN